MFTRQEYEASLVIGRAFKAYLIRRNLAFKVEKRRQLKKLKKAIGKAKFEEP
jgi:hypothetical protein